MIWNLTSFGDRIAIEEGDHSYTYQDLYQITEDIFAPIGRRSLIFVLSSNTLGSLAGYLSFLEHGVVPLMLEEKIDRELLFSLIESYRPEYLWVPSGDSAFFSGFREIYSKADYSLLKTDFRQPFPLHEQLALLINTSGSIGSPKLVRQSYRNIRANAGSIIEYLRITGEEKAITSLPMNYVYGLSVINTHIMAGASIVLTKLGCYTKGFWDLFRQKEVTSFNGVPFMYEMLYKLKLTGKPLHSLRTMTQAGGKLSPDLQKVFSEYAQTNGKRFFVMYGASEATSRMGYLPYEDALRKPGSMGIPIPGGRFELIDVNGDIINESHKTGELIYYGPNVTMGYARSGEDLCKPDEFRGRLTTGDMAYRDEEGFYYISGRKSRFIKILGKRLSLDEIELLLKEKFSSSSIACSGKDDLLLVYVTSEELMTPVYTYLAENIHLNKALCRVIRIEEIPKNASGKTLYAKLNKTGQEG